MTQAIQEDPYIKLLFQELQLDDKPPPVKDDPYIKQLPEPVTIAQAGKPWNFITAMEFAAQMMMIQEQSADPDRNILEDIPVSIVRGVALGQEQLGGIAQMVAGQIERRITGENFATKALRDAGRLSVAIGRTGRASLPRDPDESFGRRTFNDIIELFPQMVPQLGLPILTGGGSLPVQLAIFAGTAAAPVVGSQYLESLAYYEGDPDKEDKAAIEAGAAGLITWGTAFIQGYAMFGRLPIAKNTLAGVAKNFAARMPIAGAGESIQETVERIETDAFLVLMRDDPIIAGQLFAMDKGYWSGVLREAIAAFGAGMFGGGAVEIAGLKQALAEIEQGKVLSEENLLILHEALRATQLNEPGRQPGDLTFIRPSQRPVTPTPEVKDKETTDAGPRTKDQAAREPTETKEAEEAQEEEVTKEEDEVIFTSQVPAEPGQLLAGGLQLVLPTVKPIDPNALPSGVETITEVQELEADKKALVRTGKEALVQQRRRLEAEHRGDMQQLRQDLSDKARSVDEIKGRLLKVMNKNLPRQISKATANAVGRAKTRGAIAKAMRKIREERDTIQKEQAVAELKKTIGKLKPDKLRPIFADAVKGILDNIRLTTLSDKAKSRLESLQTFLVDNPEAEVPANVVAKIDELNKVPVAEMTAEEVTEMTDALDSIIQQSQLFKRLTSIQRKRSLERRVNVVAAEMSNHLTVRGVHPSGKLKRTASSIWSIPFGRIQNTMTDTLSEMLGGQDSLTWQILYKDVADAQKATMTGYYEAMDFLESAIEAEGLELGGDELALMSGELSKTRGAMKRTLRALSLLSQDQDIDATILPITLADGSVLQTTAAQRMTILATLADESTRILVVDKGVQIHIKGQAAGLNYAITEGDISAIRHSLTVPQLNILAAAMQHINTDLKQTIRNWSIVDRGFDITKPETWFPRHPVLFGNEPEIAGASFVNTVVESASIVQPRVGTGAALEINDFFAEYNNLAWATHAVANLGPAIRAAREILGSTEIKTMLKNSKQAKVIESYELTYDQLAQEAVGGPPKRGFLAKAFGPTISRVGRGILGLNIGPAIKQPVSLIVAANEMPGSFLMSSLMQGSMLDSSIDERIARNAYLRFRMDGSAVGLMNEGGGVGRQILGFKGEGENVMFLIRYFDRLAIRTIWRAAEMQAESEGLTGDAAFERASEVAERVVKRTQPTFDTLHISSLAVEAKTNTAFKLILFFRAQRSKHIDMSFRTMTRRSRGEISRTRALQQMSNIWIWQAIAFVAIGELKDWVQRGFKPPKRDSNPYMRFLFRYIDTTVGNVVFGEHLSNVGKYLLVQGLKVADQDEGTPPIYDPDISPVISLMEDLFRSSKQLISGIRERDSEDFWDGLIGVVMSVGPLRGVPTVGPLRDFKKLYDLIVDEEESSGRRSP